jgi:hypothetical protein
MRKKDYDTLYEAGEVLDSHGSLAIACNMREAASRADSTIRELAEALEPLASLLQDHNDKSYTGKPVPDDQPVFAINGAMIKIGDLRKAQAALENARVEE